MTRMLSVVGVLLVCIGTARADIRWLSTEYDFGTWHEQQGRRSGRVEFVNEGPDAVAIISVRPSCGCTGADYVRDAVEPGDTAWVSFTYDPAHRPGKFEKTIKVYTDPGRTLQVITIRGTIVGTPESLMHDFPVSSGALRLSSDSYSFGNSPEGKPRHAYLNAYNQGNDTIHPTVTFARGPLEARIARNSVAPGESFTIGLYLSTRGLSPGAHSWPLRISADTTSLMATVSIDIQAAPAPLDSASMAMAPRISVPSAPVELTARKAGGKVKFKFPVGNLGSTPLQLRRVYSRAGAVHIIRCPRVIKPGKEGTVEGYIDLSDVSGPAFGYIVEVISTDPLQPVANVRLTGQNQ